VRSSTEAQKPSHSSNFNGAVTVKPGSFGLDFGIACTCVSALLKVVARSSLRAVVKGVRRPAGSRPPGNSIEFKEGHRVQRWKYWTYGTGDVFDIGSARASGGCVATRLSMPSSRAFSAVSQFIVFGAASVK
jgi:hypothetical protein